MADDFPLPLTAYPPSSSGLLQTLSDRVAIDPFNAVATGIFLCAVVHTFLAPKFTALAHDVQHRHDAEARRLGLRPTPSTVGELLHFMGEVEVVFGLWVVALVAAASAMKGWTETKHYINDSVNFTEPMFVVVVMTIAATRPVITFAERMLRRVAALGRGTPAAWWLATLTLGPLLGSFVTEPAAMTICALVLGRQFYDLEPSSRLKYATLGLLFVNISIGGTLTHFAAPPVLMVARVWNWGTPYMLVEFGWHAALAIVVANLVYFLAFRTELMALARRPPAADTELPDEDVEAGAPSLLPVPLWVTLAHLAFLAWTVANAHYPALFVGAFLFFLGFVRATAAFQSQVSLRAPLLVGFFLGGLVIHGGLQGWWIAPTLASLPQTPLFFGAAALTALNDNALITYLATLVPNFSEGMRLAVVQGAVTGGGLTVIANAPNPAGQALLARFFGGAINPGGLLLAALVPTAIAALAFRLL